MLKQLVICVALLVVLVRTQPQPAPAPPTCPCTDAECQITERLRVESLCATNLCVNGRPVPPPDGDPCTSDGFDSNGNPVYAPIQNCCRRDDHAACEQWQGDCEMSRCVAIGGATHGTCLHERITDGTCCTSECDCAPRACHNVTCDMGTSGLKRVKRSDGTYHMVGRHNTVMQTTGECRWDRISDRCCTRNSECLDACTEDHQGFCSSGECVCVSTCKNECGTDSDCQDISITNPRLAEKSPCWENQCRKGWCQPARNNSRDADGDGILCGEDCDDNNASAGQFIYCTRENATSVDPDRDGIPRCGATVDRLCVNDTVTGEGVCPDGRLRVNLTDLSQAVFYDDHFFIDRNCDCCSMIAGIDTPIHCAVDNDGDGVYDPLPALPNNQPPIIGTPSDVCQADFCVTIEGPATDEARTLLCRDLFGPNATHLNAHERNIQCADACVDDPLRFEAQPFCPVMLPTLPGLTGSVCDQVALAGTLGNQLQACCNEIISEDAGPQYFHSARICCDHLISIGGIGSNNPADYTGICSGFGTFPFEFNKCVCDVVGGFECEPVTCVADVDRDCYYNCNKTVDTCVVRPQTITPTDRKKCNIPDWITSPAQLNEDQLCCFYGNTQGGGIPYRSLEGAQGESGQDFCDCDDGKKDRFQKVACFKDEDGDQFPFCVNGEPKCQQFCAPECPVGWIKPEDVECKNATHGNGMEWPHEGGKWSPKDKRGLEAVRSIAEKHDWFNKEKQPEWDGKHERKCPNKDCEGKRARCDEECHGVCTKPHEAPACDCCDKDCMVYPGALWASGSKTKCALPGSGADIVKDYDYNCDGCVDKHAACRGAFVKHAKDNKARCPANIVDSRDFFITTDHDDVVHFDEQYCNKTDDAAIHDPAHSGCQPSGGVCTPVIPGFENQPGAVLKRNALIDTPPFCSPPRKIDLNGLQNGIKFDECASFVRQKSCQDPDGNDICAVAHEYCLKVGI